MILFPQLIKSQDPKPAHIIPLSNLQIDSLVDIEDSAGSYFLVYSPELNGMIKCASQEGTEVQYKEILLQFDNRKTKYEWMLTFKLNLVSAPTYSLK
jgi:hypothetical protein